MEEPAFHATKHRLTERFGVEHELGIEGGTVVTGRGRTRANVYVDGGRIASVTGSRAPSLKTIDASGLLVMPGMVDAHVHFMDPGEPQREDFTSGSAAAAVAGVTTVLEHSHCSPVVSAADLEKKRRYLDGRSHVDYGLGAHAVAARLDELPGVWAAGAAFIKVFTCTTHGIEGFDAGALRRLFEAVAALDAICLAHCEDESLTAAAEKALHDARREDGAIVPEWRNLEAEVLAAYAVGLLAAVTGASVVVAHATSPETLGALAPHRARTRLIAESCPQYLCLLEHEVLSEGPLRKFTPPARARSRRDLAAMWEAVSRGEVDYIASDHAPSTLQQKMAGSIWDAPFGLPGVDTTLPLLLTGAADGRLSYERVAALYAERPAQVYGLHPRKGSLLPGADADLVLIDPAATYELRNEHIRSRAGWTPLAGRTMKGRAVHTLLRGQVVAADGALVGDRRGRFLHGRRSA
jgi:dihydroorotase (multifunctional complex type)